MKNFESFLKTLEEDKLSIYHESTEESIVIREKINEYELEFNLVYKMHVKSYSAPTYESPEEFEAEFENMDFNEIAVYQDDEIIDLTPGQESLVYSVLTTILY